MSVLSQEQSNVDCMEAIVGSPLPSDLRLWATEPLVVTEHKGLTEGSQLYKATWPNLAMASTYKPETHLALFLNAASPRFTDEYGIISDLDLILGATSQFNAQLRQRHAASFGRAWQKYEAYARRVTTALRRGPDPFAHVVEFEGASYGEGETGILGFESQVAKLQVFTHSYPAEEIKDLFETYGEPFPSNEGGYRLNNGAQLESPGTWFGKADQMKPFIEKHPEASSTLIALTGGVIFDGGSEYGQLVAYGLEDLRKEDLERMFATGEGIYSEHRASYSFRYVLNHREHEVGLIEPSVRVYNPRPHLQPMLVWQSTGGRREILYDYDISSKTVRKGNRQLRIIEDPMLGLLIPFVFSPAFRADEELWPKRDSLPTDKIAVKNGKISEDKLPTNNINPATVTLQAIRKRRQILDYFPFEKLETLAISA